MQSQRTSHMPASRPVFFFAFANDRVDDARYLRDLPEEQRALSALFLPQRARVEIEVRANTTLDEIFEVFQAPYFRDRVRIFHFAGHAASHALYFESRAGAGTAADGRGLAEFIAQQPALDLVFLNGCSSDAHAARLLAAGARAVIATSMAIDDAVATRFARHFYQGVVGGAALKQAFNEAASAVKADVGDRTRSFMPETAPGTDDWPWSLHLAPASDAGDRVLLPRRPAPRPAEGPVKLAPIVPWACDRSVQVGTLGAALVEYREVKGRRPFVIIVHGDDREGPSEFVRRLRLLTLPGLLELQRGATIEGRRVVLRDGDGRVEARVEALLGQIGECVCERATTDVTEMARAVAREKVPLLLELVWEIGPQRSAGAALIDALLARLAAWPDTYAGREVLFAVVISYREREASGLGGLWRRLTKQSEAAAAQALVAQLVTGTSAALPRISLPTLESVGLGDALTWIGEHALRAATTDEDARLLLEERLRPLLEALFDPQEVRLRMRDLVRHLRENFDQCVQQEGHR